MLGCANGTRECLGTFSFLGDPFIHIIQGGAAVPLTCRVANPNRVPLLEGVVRWDTAGLRIDYLMECTVLIPKVNKSDDLDVISQFPTPHRYLKYRGVAFLSLR
jgi:hypothetical protein